VEGVGRLGVRGGGHDEEIGEVCWNLPWVDRGNGEEISGIYLRYIDGDSVG